MMDKVIIERIDDDNVIINYNGEVFRWTMEQARLSYIGLSLLERIALAKFTSIDSRVL